MPLTLSHTITLDSTCGITTFTDTTGAYDASTNTGGYGTPNAGKGSNATYITLTIKNLTTDTSYTAIELDLDETSQSFNITTLTNAADSISDTTYPDGVYTFTFSHKADDDETYTSVVTKLFTCAVSCRLATYAQQELGDCLTCGDKLDFGNKYIGYRGLLSGIRYLAQTGDYTNVKTVLDCLNDFLDNEDCKNC